jgi:F420-dependent oxidoreductase-like protein
MVINEKLQFGFALPQGWRWLDEGQGTTAVEQYKFSRRIAQIAEETGYDSVYAYDHLIPSYEENLEKNFFECYTLLSAIMANTTKLRIGQIVTCNSFRNPALLAKMLSTLDAIGNGRAELGIGAGWYEGEYLSFGYKYPSSIERIVQLSESLNIIKAMWVERKATFAGQYFSVKDAFCYPKPVQKPHPTIMVGGTGEKHLLRVVAKYANRYNNPFSSPLHFKRKVSILKEHCTTVGRDYKEIEKSVLLRCLIRESDDELNKNIEKWKRKDETIEQFKKRLCSNIIGTPEQVVSKLNQYVDLGVTHVILHFIAINEQCIKLFYRNVIKNM